MKVSKTIQIDQNELLSHHFDLFLVSSGFESRSRYLVEKYDSLIIADNKVCIKFNNHKEHPNRIANDEVFIRHAFEMRESSGDDGSVISTLLDSILINSPNKTLHILFHQHLRL